MIRSIFLFSAAVLVSCSSGEQDGRQYASSNASPVAGKMGVSYRRVKADHAAPAADASQPKTVQSDGLLGSLTADNNSEPPGLFDRNEKPDEPGAEYWLHGQQSASPVAGKMGVRVSRRKK